MAVAVYTAGAIAAKDVLWRMLPMRILFVTSNRIGDAVLSTGLLDHLIRTYPDSRITVACGHGGRRDCFATCRTWSG